MNFWRMEKVLEENHGLNMLGTFGFEINCLVCIKGEIPFQGSLSHVSIKAMAQWYVGGTS